MEKSKEVVGEPSPDVIREWVKKDLQSAHYLLGLVLERYPEVVEAMADQIVAHVKSKENGAAIDHVKNAS